MMKAMHFLFGGLFQVAGLAMTYFGLSSNTPTLIHTFTLFIMAAIGFALSAFFFAICIGAIINNE